MTARAPVPQAAPEALAARAWAQGVWLGLAAGVPCGVALAVLLELLR